MTTMRRFSILFIAMALIVPAALADDVPQGSQILDAEGAFNVLKQLEGTWEGEALVVPVGESKEDELALSAERLDVDTALRWGLVDSVEG